MIKENRSRIILGQVFYQNQWMPIEKKIDLEAQRRKKIEEGYVFFQGEWIPLEEKLARISHTKIKKDKPQKVVYNQQTYNINQNQNFDNRVTHEHEHRHVHIDPQNIPNYTHEKTKNTLPSKEHNSLEAEERKQIQEKMSQQKMISHDEKYARFLEDQTEEYNSQEEDDSE